MGMCLVSLGKVESDDQSKPHANVETTDVVINDFWALREESVVAALGFNNADVGHVVRFLVDTLTDLVYRTATHLWAILEGLNDDDRDPSTFEEATFDVKLLDSI